MKKPSATRNAVTSRLRLRDFIRRQYIKWRLIVRPLMQQIKRSLRSIQRTPWIRHAKRNSLRLLRINHQATRRKTPALIPAFAHVLLIMISASVLFAFTTFNPPFASTANVFESTPFTAIPAHLDAAAPLADTQADETFADKTFATPPESLALNNSRRPHFQDKYFASNSIDASTDTQTSPNTDATPAPVSTPTDTDAWRTVTVKKNDSLSLIFKRNQLDIKDAYAIAQLQDAALKKIRPGQKIELNFNPQNELVAVRYRYDEFSALLITRAGDATSRKFIAQTITRTPEIKLRSKKAIIFNNLLGAAKDAGVDYETIYRLAEIFGWQIDFNREIQSGDQFSVIYEELYLDGVKIRSGDIIAAELITSKGQLRVLRHLDEQGNVAYYAPNGDGVERSFLRSPVKFGRITSGFSRSRYHPILKKWRAHKGVDYGAPRGTPIRSTGDGVVTQVKRNRGYGKHIVVRHGIKYTTLYAHLNGFAKGIKVGSRITQGKTIGYVGSTGWATGPHLHYEFRVNGGHRNPLTVKLPKSNPIDAKYRQTFLAEAAVWVAKLDKISTSPLAQKPSRNSVRQ